jgi:DNA/RNA-binding domain of Phe-tRNA-synthetase-like protein
MIEPLHISDEVTKKLPGLVVIAGFLDVGSIQTQLISGYLTSSWNKLGTVVREHGGHKAHPHIQQWHEALRRAGVSLKKCPPSIEAIAKRTAKSDSPFSINPVVDTYNGISMDLVLPFGAYDLDQLDGSLYLRVCEQPESFTPLGSGKPEETVVGEIVYADDTDILTRHFLWRQADKGKITDGSRRFVFVCELIESMGEDTIRSAKGLIEEQFSSLLGGILSNIVILR